ncbi:MAG: hypothetical protein E7559_08265 [Ruminococcaceae bacterium]|nr:hypothetical protein [Oscillospiraceae bacterium]
MNQIAFFWGSISIYWSSIFFALAIIGSVFASLQIRAIQNKTPNAVLLTALISIPLSLLFSRLVYWYCSFEQYRGILDALTSFGEGGHSLVGAAIGLFLATVIVWRLNMVSSLMQLWDCVLPGSMIGIAIGRLSGFFSADDKGKIMFDNPSLQRLPFAVEIVNEATGTSDWRLATFLFESVAALIVFFVCHYIIRSFHQTNLGKEKVICSLPDGSVAMICLSFFGSLQVVLESTRYDSLFLRTNGFISLMQMVCLALVLTSIIFFSYHSIKINGGVDRKHIFTWLLCVILIGQSAYVEYYVQRHANEYFICYTVMSIAMISVSLLIIQLCCSCSTRSEK